VLEAGPQAGGRTHTHHFGPGHWTDDGAGWLGSFYPDTLALLDELGFGDRPQVMRLRGGGDLLVGGRLHPNPNSVRRILTTDLLSPAEKLRLLAWMARLFLTQPGDLRIDEREDATTAAAALRSIGHDATEWVVRPSFEGPFFSRLEELSATLIRSWLRALSVGTFFQMSGGMDSPWRYLGERLGIRTDATVERVAPVDGGVEVVIAGVADRYDGVVVAVPAPVAVGIVAAGALPAAVADIEYAPHVRLYLARRGDGPPRRGIHAFPNETVATVEYGAGGHGAWGRVPPGWEWALICAPAASSRRLQELPHPEHPNHHRDS
jgi:protoporphyrinogen oxidase